MFVNVIILFTAARMVQCINLTKLEVPAFADPRSPVELVCMWDLGTEKLQSVKWFRDDVEFFEHRPEGASYISYPAHGIRNQKCECDIVLARCTMAFSVLAELSTALYKCEVSAERPRFLVASGQKTMSVFVPSKARVTGLPPTVVPDTDILLNCSTELSLPASSITWFVNDQKIDSKQNTLKHQNGLFSSWSTMIARISPDEVKYVECRTEQLGYGRQMAQERHRLAVAEHPVRETSELIEPSRGEGVHTFALFSTACLVAAAVLSLSVDSIPTARGGSTMTVTGLLSVTILKILLT